MDLKNEFSEPASAKYTADENSTTPAIQGRKHRFSGFNAPGGSVPHVAVAHGRHRDHRPPERVRYRFEEAVLRAGLCEVDRRREQHHTCNAHKRKARVKMVYVIIHAVYVGPADTGNRPLGLSDHTLARPLDHTWNARVRWCTLSQDQSGPRVMARWPTESHLNRPSGIYARHARPSYRQIRVTSPGDHTWKVSTWCMLSSRKISKVLELESTEPNSCDDRLRTRLARQRKSLLRNSTAVLLS